MHDIDNKVHIKIPVVTGSQHNLCFSAFPNLSKKMNMLYFYNKKCYFLKKKKRM